jgi:hypothetical protein
LGEFLKENYAQAKRDEQRRRREHLSAFVGQCILLFGVVGLLYMCHELAT